MGGQALCNVTKIIKFLEVLIWVIIISKSTINLLLCCTYEFKYQIICNNTICDTTDFPYFHLRIFVMLQFLPDSRILRGSTNTNSYLILYLYLSKYLRQRPFLFRIACFA